MLEDQDSQGIVLSVDRILRLEPGSEECRAAAVAYVEHELVTLNNLIATDKHGAAPTWITDTSSALKALRHAFGLKSAVPGSEDAPPVIGTFETPPTPEQAERLNEVGRRNFAALEEMLNSPRR